MILAYFILQFNQLAFAQACLPTPERHATSLSGEVSGNHAFRQSVTNDWTVQLLPSKYGWDLRITGKDGVDLSQITPPFRQAPNSREIYGWHFRNANNTARNTGDVNAPQYTRPFVFSPSLTGTGGFKPSSSGLPIDAQNHEVGRGVLRVLDMGLTDLEKGQQARMNYLKFDICLSWPKSDDEIKEKIDAINPNYSNEETEIFYSCGLDRNLFELSAWVLPRLLSGDLDGDNSNDLVVPITRKSDNHKAIAICRAGTWLSLIGIGPNSEVALKSEYYTFEQYLDKVEFWELRTRDNPADVLIMGQIEKSEVAIRWDYRNFVTELHSHIIEP